jgi:hypothetical protein
LATNTTQFSTRRCARINRVVRWVGIEIREHIGFNGVNELGEFIKKYEGEVL